MPTDDDLLLVRLIRQIAIRENRWSEEGLIPAELGGLYAYLWRTFRRCDEAEVDGLLRRQPASGSLLDIDGFVYLEPFHSISWIVPLLTFEYRFADSPKVCLRIDLFAPSGHSLPSAVGYRLETPEGNADHNYHHLQHIRQFGRDKYDLPSQAWMPEESPAFIVDASSHVGLLVGMLVAMYGANQPVVTSLVSGWREETIRKHLGGRDWAIALLSDRPGPG